MKLRRARSEDDHEALQFLQALILPHDKPLKTGLGAWWLVEDVGGEPVAFAGIKPSLQWLDTMYLCRAGVIPELRGHGLQKSLIAVRERYARRMGMAWLISDTTDNPASANSLASRGFRMFEPSRPWGGSKRTLYWRKRI